MNEQLDGKQWIEQAISKVLYGLYSAEIRLAKNATDAEDLVGDTDVKV